MEACGERWALSCQSQSKPHHGAGGDPGAENAHADPLPPAAQDDLQRCRKYLRLVGLFDEAYYVTAYPDILQANIDPFEHFFLHGYLEGRQPNAIFDPVWYLANYPEVKALNAQPLLHYAQFGEREGRRPSVLFDPTWYRHKYGVPVDQNALAHYLKHRIGPFSPIPEFDGKYYLETYPDVADAKVDPFEHFMFQGYYVYDVDDLSNPSPLSNLNAPAARTLIDHNHRQQDIEGIRFQPRYKFW